MGARDRALERSRSALTAKVPMLADTLGRPLRVIITAGQVGDHHHWPSTTLADYWD